MKELTIRSERKADQNNEVYHFQFSAQKLDDKESLIKEYKKVYLCELFHKFDRQKRNFLLEVGYFRYRGPGWFRGEYFPGTSLGQYLGISDVFLENKNLRGLRSHAKRDKVRVVL